MAKYLGNRPTAVPLTSADIEDGVISAADLGANSVDSSELVNGSVDLGHLSASGTASSSTFLRGDNSWVAAGGDISFGGDTFGANQVIGANDAYSFSLETSGNTALTIDANGIITKPLQSAFHGYIPAVAVPQNITGDGTVYTWIPTEDEDRNGDFTTSTFTAPVDGLYHCFVQQNILNVDSSMTGGTSYIATSNRTYYWHMNPYGNSSSGTLGFSHSVIADLDASDTVIFKIAVSGSTKTADVDDVTAFGVVLLC